MRVEEIEAQLAEPIEHLRRYLEICAAVEIELWNDQSDIAIVELRAVQQILWPLNEELNRMGVLIQLSQALSQAMLNISLVIWQTDEIITHLVLLKDMKRISEPTLRKRRYIAGLIQKYITDIQLAVRCLRSITSPAASNGSHRTLSLVLVNEVQTIEEEA